MLSIVTVVSAGAEFGEAQSLNVFEIVLVGFSFVFGILLLLSLITWIFGKVFAHLYVEAPPTSVGAEAVTLLPPSEHSPLGRTEASDFDVSDPHHIAVITAAIHCVMKERKHRIVSIRSSDSSWAAEGRRQIFSSRRVRQI